jgi:SAM-dependent methyltransferase
MDTYTSGILDEAEGYAEGALGDIRGKHILDYGCGIGENTIRLADRGAIVTGFDISETRLREAKGRALNDRGERQGLFAVAAAESLPFADESFDGVFGKQILHHLDLHLAMDEVRRVLRPGGRAVFMEPLIHNPLLEAYRRLTPHLRSQTEKALGEADLRAIRAHFRASERREFVFLSMVPVILGSLLRRPASLQAIRAWLQRMDRRLANTLPFMGRYYWTVVITLER